MASLMLIGRYVFFVCFVICNAIISSAAVWNFALAQLFNKILGIDAYLASVSAIGLLYYFIIAIVELLRGDAFTAKVWFELVWVGVFFLLEFTGAIAMSAITPSVMCRAEVVAVLPQACTSTHVVLAFVWMSTLLLLAYFTLLGATAYQRSKHDPSVWYSSVHRFNWGETHLKIWGVPTSPALPRFRAGARVVVDIFPKAPLPPARVPTPAPPYAPRPDALPVYATAPLVTSNTRSVPPPPSATAAPQQQQQQQQQRPSRPTVVTRQPSEGAGRETRHERLARQVREAAAPAPSSLYPTHGTERLSASEQSRQGHSDAPPPPVRAGTAGDAAGAGAGAGAGGAERQRSRSRSKRRTDVPASAGDAAGAGAGASGAERQRSRSRRRADVPASRTLVGPSGRASSSSSSASSSTTSLPSTSSASSGPSSRKERKQKPSGEVTTTAAAAPRTPPTALKPRKSNGEWRNRVVIPPPLDLSKISTTRTRTR